MKLRFFLFLLAFINIASNLFCEEKQSDAIAAIVNEDIITYGDVYKRIKSGVDEIEASDLPDGQKEIHKQVLFRRALQEMVDNRLTIQEAKRYNVELDEKLVNEEIEEEAEKAGGMTKFLKALRDEGITLEEFSTSIRERLTAQQLFWKKSSYSPKDKQRAAIDTYVSPSEIRKYYAFNIKEFSKESQIKIRMITIFFYKHGGKTQSMDLANAIVKEFRKGANFSELAKTYSDDKYGQLGGTWPMREVNGETVWVSVKKGEALRKEVEEVAFSLREGECSEPILCGDDSDNPIFCQIVMVENREAGGEIPFEQVQDDIRMKLRRQKLVASLLRMKKSLRAKAFIWPENLFKEES